MILKLLTLNNYNDSTMTKIPLIDDLIILKILPNYLYCNNLTDISILKIIMIISSSLLIIIMGLETVAFGRFYLKPLKMAF